MTGTRRLGPCRCRSGALLVVALAATGLTGCRTVPMLIRVAPTGTGPIPVARIPAPIRAAFYYPWFPEAWAQQGQNPFTSYRPTRGWYATDVGAVRTQIADMQYAGIRVGLASWFGPGSTTDRHWPALMQAAAGTGFAWAPYYEREGISDPSPHQIADDLHYLLTQYRATGSPLFTVDGKELAVFVYNADDLNRREGCRTVRRWDRARHVLFRDHREGVYIDLKVFPGYASCPRVSAVNGWHQYGPVSADQNFAAAPGDGAYAISPGYWKSGSPYGVAPFLVRDRARWQRSIASMRASGAKWQLITTYNEWGEGTAIESASACRAPAPGGALCDWSAGGSASTFLTDLHNGPVS